MSKHALIADIAIRTNESQATVGRVLDALATETFALLRKGAEVPLPGLGKLKAVQKKARTGRNPATGEPIEIEAKVVPKFFAGKVLKDAIN
jgi:DNA-binding protein HU-beta